MMTEQIQRITIDDIRRVRFRCDKCDTVTELRPKNITETRAGTCRTCGDAFNAPISLYPTIRTLFGLLEECEDVTVEFEITPPDARAG